MGWNPLYPADEETGSLDDAIREAEWEDSMKEMEREWRKSHGLDEE